MSNPTYGSNDPGSAYDPDPAYADPTPSYADPTPSYADPDPGYAGGGYVSDVSETAVPPVYEAPVDPAVGYGTSYDTSVDTGASSSAGSKVSETKDVAKDEAANVKDTAVEAGKNVAGTAKEEAANVASEAGAQAKSLLGTATSELQSQAGTQQNRLASTVRSYADELHGLVDKSDGGGALTDLAHQAASKGTEIASWLEDREPKDVLEEMRRFARRRPGLFLVLCGAAGVLAGRVTRGAVAANTNIDSPKPSRALESTPAAPTAPDYYASPAPVATSYETTPTYGAYTDAPTSYAETSQGYPEQGGFAR